MEFSPLKYIYKPSGVNGANTLLLLHGTGGDERDLLPFATHFPDDMNLLSLRGNVSENGLPRFFKRLGMGIFDENDLEFRTSELRHFLTEIAMKEHFDVSKMVALGYSNGANIAGSLLVSHPGFLAAAILLRPMRPFKDKKIIPNISKTPILITSGRYDTTVSPDETAAYVRQLELAGFDVTARNLPNGHELGRDDLQIASKWYREII